MSDSEWFDLTQCIPVSGYSAHPIMTMDPTGAGRALLLRLQDGRDGEVFEFILSPSLAGQISWETLGIVGSYIEAAFGPRLLPDDEELLEQWQEFLEERFGDET